MTLYKPFKRSSKSVSISHVRLMGESQAPACVDHMVHLVHLWICHTYNKHGLILRIFSRKIFRMMILRECRRTKRDTWSTKNKSESYRKRFAYMQLGNRDKRRYLKDRGQPLSTEWTMYSPLPYRRTSHTTMATTKRSCICTTQNSS